MPVPDAPIKIFFTGLLVFGFNKHRKHCQIGLHSGTDDHELRIRLVKRRSDPESESEQIMTFSHDIIRQASSLWMDIEGDEGKSSSDAKAFIAGDLNKPPTDPQDFRWLVDLEGKSFYNHPLKIRKGVLMPTVIMATGLFYTAMLSPDLYRTVPVATDRSKRSARSCSLGHVAVYIGANIYLKPRQALVLRACQQNGSELFRLSPEDKATYEITIDNGDTPLAPTDQDFHYYYDAIELDRDEPMILIERCGLPIPGGSEIPCIPVGVGLGHGWLF